MAYDEQARLALMQRLEQLLGEENARTMMEHLPPTGWDDLATKRDLEDLATKTDLQLLRRDMATGFADLRADLRGEITAAITSQTRSMIFAVLGAVVVMTGLVLGFARPV